MAGTVQVNHLQAPYHLPEQCHFGQVYDLLGGHMAKVPRSQGARSQEPRVSLSFVAG